MSGRAGDGAGVVRTRREVLRLVGFGLLAMPLVAGAGCAAGPASVRATPSRARGSATVDVRAKGARGDGRTDDTAAFQAAIDALPDSGGTVVVPAGTYAIDAVRRIVLRSRMRLQLAPGAVLAALPNGERQSSVLFLEKVADVEITGGRIVGERDRHLVPTGEWGHGIRMRGASRVTVRDIRISNCWGDGICIGGADAQQRTPSEDIVIAGVTCNGNRRQGLSIGRTRLVRVYDSEFSDTAGTAPQFGIDIEPDRPGDTQDVRIENCLVRNNRGGGIQIYRRVSGVVIQGCTIEDNRGQGILAVGASGGTITGNCIQANGMVGVGLRQQASDFEVSGNTFSGNGSRNRGRGRGPALGQSRMRGNATDVAAGAIRAGEDTSGIRIGANQYL